MEIRHTTDGGLVVTIDGSSDGTSMDSVEVRSIISVKEARKLLGKELSDAISDLDLMGIVGLMSHLADGLLEAVSVPQNTVVGV